MSTMDRMITDEVLPTVFGAAFDRINIRSASTGERVTDQRLKARVLLAMVEQDDPKLAADLKRHALAVAEALEPERVADLRKRWNDLVNDATESAILRAATSPRR